MGAGVGLMERKPYAPPMSLRLRPQPRDPLERYAAVFVLWTWGLSLTQIGRLMGLTRNRLHQMRRRAYEAFVWPRFKRDASLRDLLSSWFGGLRGVHEASAYRPDCREYRKQFDQVICDVRLTLKPRV